MAETLKTFEENDDILASETNGNNQFLLSKITDMSAIVQNYIEGEIATIKTSLATMQATLQNNINNLKVDMFAAISPDYSKGVSIESGYKSASYGIGYVRFKANSASGYVKVDGQEVAYDNGSVNYHQTNGSSFLVSPNSTITATNYEVLKFFPCAGF